MSDNGGLPGATVTDVLPSAAVTAGRIAKFNSALATDVVDSIITEASGKIGIGTTTPVGTIDVGGWASIPGDIQGVGSTISGDVFMGNTNGGIGRFRMASNALQGFFSWNQYYNGTNHKGMDATAPGWRVNIGGTGAEDTYYVERSPATAGGHVPARLFVVNGNGNVGINTGTAAPLGTLDVGGWPAIPNDIQGVGSTISGDVFMGNTNGGIGRYRMASNALQGFFSWNQYYNGVGHKGMDATAPGWRINVGGTGIEDAFYVERSPATAGLHAPSRLFQVSGSGNVGIGTAAPTAKLDVAGAVKSTGLTLTGNGAAAGRVLTSDANGVASWQLAPGAGGTATDVNCPAGCVETADITDGTIANADIANAAAIAPTKIAGTAAILGANTFAGAQTINNNTTVLNDLTVDTTTLKVDSLSNRVGIGTATPAFPLHVVANNNTGTGLQARVENTATTGNSFASYSMLANNGGVVTQIYSDGLGTGPLATPGGHMGTFTNHPLGLFTGNLERVRIAADGKVGIGNRIPVAQLHVYKGIGLPAEGLEGNAIMGECDGSFVLCDGVRGRTSSPASYGVYGQAFGDGGYGVVGQSSSASGYGVYSIGNVHVAGALSKSSGAFKIDHPLDPENKYLYHSFVESPDMKNIYDGNVITNADGEATIELPDYFEALNRDFRYQLTVIGQFAQAIVAEEIRGGRFSIKTDKPGVKVSWQVTGIRKDPFAEANRIQVEEAKPAAERGYYLYPQGYGQPAERGYDPMRRSEPGEISSSSATQR